MNSIRTFHDYYACGFPKKKVYFNIRIQWPLRQLLWNFFSPNIALTEQFVTTLMYEERRGMQFDPVDGDIYEF